MTIPVKLPDVDAWKAQVKCQTACPVNTDAGRYVQLIAEARDEEAFLVARAEPVRVDLRPRLRGAM